MENAAGGVTACIMAILIGNKGEVFLPKKYFSILSACFLILSVLPLVAGLTKWGNPLYEWVLSISLFLPLSCALLGLIFAFAGAGGKVKGSLIIMNALGVSLSAFIVFIAFFGFNQP